MTKPVFITDFWGFNHFEFGHIHVKFEFNKKLMLNPRVWGGLVLQKNHPGVAAVNFCRRRFKAQIEQQKRQFDKVGKLTSSKSDFCDVKHIHSVR